MEDKYMTSGDVALWADARDRRGYGYGEGYGYYHRGSRGMAATGIGLAAGLGGGALLLAVAGLWGLNQASKARARGAETTAAAQADTMRMLTGVLTREATRQDGVNINVEQTLRSLTGASAQGGSAAANAFANAEAIAAILGNNGGLNSAVEQIGTLRVTPVSLPKSCCNTCGD